MSYIINNTSPFISVKITQSGREKLAIGKLNFTYWGIGDSEINYNQVEVSNNNQSDVTLSASSRILRPVDRQPNIKSFITTGGSENLMTLNSSNLKLVKVVVNNEAEERGFFSGNGVTFLTLTGSTYIRSTGTITNSTFTGGTTLLLSSASTRNADDIILIKLTNNNVTGQTINSNTLPIPHLWFKIQSTNSTSITVDRNLPNLSTMTGSSSQFIIYRSGEVYNSIATGSTTSYWDSGTLSFDSCCDISCGDVPVWNQNNIWCEDLAGLTGTSYENYTKFGSYQYLGTKNPYLEYLCVGTATTSDTVCDAPGLSIIDSVKKSIAVIHYTNNVISNVYGDYLYINNDSDKTIKLYLPDLMYHRRNYGTASGTTMGMTFIGSGDTKFIGSSDIEYIDLIEDSTLVSDTPIAVGKVFPQLKIVVIDDDELVAAMSYKANRNWTLPSLSATLSSSSGNTSTGILTTDKTMYLTYVLENNTSSGLTNSLPCQTYTKITNTTSSAKDVSFKISNVDQLPYMRKIENVGYDGFGFYAYNFRVMYQIVEDINDRPDPAAWKAYDMTTTAITITNSATINPKLLENQIPSQNGFVLTTIINSGATTYSLIQSLNLAPNVSPNNLQFGDERFYYGNLTTFIGANIYKTLFDLRVNPSQFSTTTNPTRSIDDSTNPPDIVVTEVGIYDSDKDLVVIGKISKPVQLSNGKTIMLELSLDF